MVSRPHAAYQMSPCAFKINTLQKFQNAAAFKHAKLSDSIDEQHRFLKNTYL